MMFRAGCMFVGEPDGRLWPPDWCGGAPIL